MNKTAFYNQKASRNYLVEISKIARSAGELLRDNFALDPGIELSEFKDIKTRADIAANEFIVSSLQKISSYQIVTEEDKLSHKYIQKNESPVWFVDPLDGTMNFVRSFPVYCVSIALWEVNKPLIGVIYDISRDELFSGIHGMGASKNDHLISVSGISTKSNAIMATGFPSGRKYDTKSLLTFVEKIQNYKKIRMIGSAALSIAQVASGSFDVYCEEDIYIWDVAAGLALVEAAGGKTFHSMPDELGRLNAVAWNGKFSIKDLI